MDPNLQKELSDKYPNIFFENGKKRKPFLVYGIECHDGWHPLIALLLYNIQWEIENNQAPPVHIAQIKEKFGGLRFYYDGGNKVIAGMVRMAESISYSICEYCGQTGTRRGGGWILTLCDPCQTKREENRNKNVSPYPK